MRAVEVIAQLEPHLCPDCGILYGVPVNFIMVRQKDHRIFTCPNGHQRYFPSKSREEELEEELQQERQRHYQLESQNKKLNKQLDETLEQINRAKKRANAGLCPHCRRHFVNVERHIQTKHKNKLQEIPR